MIVALYFSTNYNVFEGIEAHSYGLISVACIFDTLAMASMCIAFQSDDTCVVSLVGYIAIVYSLLVDLYVFKEKMGIIELIGCAIVILLTIVLAVRKIKQIKY